MEKSDKLKELIALKNEIDLIQSGIEPDMSVYKQDKKKWFALMKKILFEDLRRKKEIELRYKMDQYQITDEEITEFFKKEGVTILYYFISVKQSISSLEFLLEVVPKQSLLDGLQEKDYSIIKLLMSLHVIKETYDISLDNNFLIFVFKFLLTIDPHGGEAFIRSNFSNKEYMNDEIMKCFLEAKKQFSEQESKANRGREQELELKDQEMQSSSSKETDPKSKVDSSPTPKKSYLLEYCRRKRKLDELYVESPQSSKVSGKDDKTSSTLDEMPKRKKRKCAR